MRLSLVANAGFICISTDTVPGIRPKLLQLVYCVVQICLITMHIPICHGDTALT